ncbi:hypothetical protein [Zobellella sp. DQSA1]|uniref:hypothetical protein n=1 Tax=Zobellella sp. DQSA1 TaxID=3342386 RepID=UPI0035C1575C
MRLNLQTVTGGSIPLGLVWRCVCAVSTAKNHCTGAITLIGLLDNPGKPIRNPPCFRRIAGRRRDNRAGIWGYQAGLFSSAPAGVDVENTIFYQLVINICRLGSMSVNEPGQYTIVMFSEQFHLTIGGEMGYKIKKTDQY